MSQGKEKTKMKAVSNIGTTMKFLQWAVRKEYERNGRTKINYFKLIIDPDSYTRTITNLFTFSYLIRDGRVKIINEQEYMAYLLPVSNEEFLKATNECPDYKQALIPIDYNKWIELKEYLQIESSILSHWKTEWDAKNETIDI